MKRYFPILLAAALTLGTSFVASAATSQDELYKTIQTEIREKNFVDAVAKARQALDDKTLSPRDKVRFLNAAADASMKQSPAQYTQVKAFYEQIVADSAVSNNDKITALNNLANAYITTLAGQYLDRMDLTPANEILARALKLPNLTPQERAAALKNIGALDEREDRYDDATAVYQEITTLEVVDSTKKSAWQSIADLDATRGKDDDAITIYQKQGFDLITLYKKLGRNDEVVAEVTKVLDDPAANDKDRWAAFMKLPYWDRVSTNYPVLIRDNIAGIQQMAQKYLPVLMETDANRATVLLSSFKSTPVFRNSFYDRDIANPAYIAWATPFLLKAPKLSDKDYALVKTKYINALAALEEKKDVAGETASMENDPRLDKATQFWAKIVNIAFTSKTADAVKAAQAEKTLPEKDKAQAILDAAQTALQADNGATARGLDAVYEGLFAHMPQAAIQCTFTDNAPFDVGSWLVSPLLKNKKDAAKLDRPYGDNLQFLLATDSSTTGRNTNAASAQSTGDIDTDFHIACDARGIHFFFNAYDSHVQEVLDGLLSGGSFEMYLAPGKNQAYYTFLPRLPNGKIDTGPGSFITMYPNSGWRLPSTDDGTLRYSVLPTNYGFGVSLSLSWESFYDKLPANGTKWQFEAIRWTRAGGFSFAGSQSVHNRSSWGDIVFSGLTDKNLIAIKRGIIFKALAKYKTAIKVTGDAGKWADPELGDPAFYQQDIEPLLHRWEQYASKVNGEMTDADVEVLFQQAVPDWMEINYRIAALRRQYLMDKEMGTPKVLFPAATQR
jgi:tetratricopeptide (TPR) repeat protein